MMDKSGFQGTCRQCGATVGKSEMLAHLQRCEVRPGGRNGDREDLYQLRIEDRYGGTYWLDVELPASTSLGQLDVFLRRTWLDCCSGHTSAFEIGDTHYVTPFDARMAVLSSERNMDVSLREALTSSGGTFMYDYDFESPTHLMGQLIRARTGTRGDETVRLLARNNPIERFCADCENSAAYICSYYHDNPFFCDVHAAAHSCGRYALLPVVNSPRMGVCSYQRQPSRRPRAV